MTVITMSRKELARLQVLIDVADRRVSIDDAAALIGITRRQTYRLLDVFRQRGAEGLVSVRRGKPSNRAHGSVFRETVLSIVRDRYTDFGPTLAAEKLREVHGLPVGVETRRQWMVKNTRFTEGGLVGLGLGAVAGGYESTNVGKVAAAALLNAYARLIPQVER